MHRGFVVASWIAAGIMIILWLSIKVQQRNFVRDVENMLHESSSSN